LLIDSLIEYRRRKGHDITLVFDGWKTGEGKESQTATGGIKVVYSKIGENADSVIKRMISSDRREWIVVTGDRDISQHAWSVGSVPVSTEDFLKVVEREESSDSVYEEYDQEYMSPPRKGNPRRQSKKEKAIMRVLKKL
jgi:predicted RNA-binding protein with PIN domain